MKVINTMSDCNEENPATVTNCVWEKIRCRCYVGEFSSSMVGRDAG